MVTCWMRFVFIGLVVVASCLESAVYAQNKSTQIETWDVRDWDFSQRRALKGNWTMIENKLVDFDAFDHSAERSVTFPSLLNDLHAGGRGTGVATYGLVLIVPPNIGSWTFEIPPLYNSYNLWVNGRLIAKAGDVGESADTSRPQWIYQVAECKGGTDTLAILLQLSNFHHYKGGASDPIYVAAASSVNSYFTCAVGSGLMASTIVLFTGLYFLFLYKRYKKKEIIFFSLICITWAVRALFSKMYPLALAYPGIDWEWSVKAEYLTLYLMVIWAAFFFHELFVESRNLIFTYLPVFLNGFFILFTLVTPAIIYTRWISVYLLVAGLVIMYGVTLVVRALVVEKEGSWFLMGSIWTGILIFAYDIAAYYTSFSYNVIIMNVGYIVIFALTSIGLFYHLGILKHKNLKEKDYLTMEDLYG